MNIKENMKQREEAEYTALSANRDAALRLLETVRKDTPQGKYVYVCGQRFEVKA